MADNNINASLTPESTQAEIIKAERLLKRATDEINDKQYVVAEGLLREAINTSPSNSTAHNNLGFALKNQERFKEAISEYEKAINLRGEFYAEAQINMAVALEQIGRMREAEGVYLKVLRHTPSSSEAHLNFALLLEDESRNEEAIGHYYTFVNLTDNNELKALANKRITVLR